MRSSLKNFEWKVFSRAKLIFFLREKIEASFSNKFIKRALERGVCKVNGRVETFASCLLKENDLVELDENWHKTIKSKEFKILYEDEFLCLVDKPTGFICEDKNLHKIFPENFRLVHRLDKETSGVLILAKSLKVKEEMKKLFSSLAVKKSYFALVDGEVKGREGVIETLLVKKREGIWASSEEGLFAKTIWKRVKAHKTFSSLICFPVTGRTHQLRVHFSEIGHPILGDYHYSKKFIFSKHVPRLMLHSLEVEFIHPFSMKNVKIKAAIPKEFYEKIFSS